MRLTISSLALAAVNVFAVTPDRNMMSAIPMHFEPNLGQTDARVRFTARGGGMSIYLTAGETVIARRSGDPVRMKLRGGRAASFEPLERLPGVSNYYRGNDPKKWREGVPHYARVRAKSVYEGVDVVYYGNGRKLEYDFVVAPHADASKIELAYEGIERMRVDKDGALVLVTASGELRQRKPLVYQEVEGRRVEVAASYRIRGESVRFELARYNAERPLVIDPILEYGTYLGGDNGDVANTVASDSTGTWVGGYTTSPNFPVMSPVDSTSIDYEGFVTKLNVAGTALVFSTFLGGTNPDIVNALAVDPSGNTFLTGNTSSQDFPLTAAFQSTYGGNADAIAARMGPTGVLTFATFLGGGSSDQCSAITLTSTAITIACTTSSANFLGDTTAGSDRPVLARLPLSGAIVTFAKTLTGASAFQALAADASGAVYVAGTTQWGASVPGTPGAFQVSNAASSGSDAFVAKLNPAGDQWAYVTHLGGSGADYGYAVAVDAAGQAYIAGSTGSTNFPVRNAHQATLGTSPYWRGEDAFLTVLNATGSALVFSTYLGGPAPDSATSIALTAGGSAVIGGIAGQDFPIVAGWRSAEHYYQDAFVAKFTSAGALVYSSYFGSTGNTTLRALAPGPSGAVYLAGYMFVYTSTAPGTVTQGAFDTVGNGGVDAFVARFVDGPAPVQVTVTSNPVGRQVIVDGRTVTTPAVFSWQPGASHSLNANAPQIDGQTLYTFTNWSQGGTASQVLTAPATAATYTVNYTGAPCPYSFAPNTFTAGFERRYRDANVITPDLCKWTPQSSASWLTPELSSYERTGSSKLFFTVAVNLGGPRSATITAGTATLTVTQAGSRGGFAAPTLTAPFHNQTLQTRGVNFNWTPVAGAGGYELRILQSQYCCPNADDTLVYLGQQAGANSTSTTIDLPDGPFAAYVRACGTGGFGDANCGTYATLPFTVNLLAPDQYPVILSPVDNQTLRSSTNLISWEPLPGATSYEVTLTNQQTNRTELFINTPTLSTIFTMKSSTQYNLQVRGCQFKCNYYGSTINFRVQLPTLSQTPPSGLNAQIANGNTLNLSWNPVTGADLYRVQVVQPNAGPGGGSLTVAARQVSTTSVSMPVPAGTATVVVNACNGDGCGPASTVAINPVGPNPSVPVVASPMPVVVADGPNVTISWSRIPGDNGSNTDYRLYVGDLSRDGPALDVVTKSNFYGAFLRAEGRRYDALVFATQNGNTVVGPASGLMVAGTSATASLITAPTHNSTFKQGPFRLAWAPIPNAVRYQYYVARQGQSTPVLTGVTPGLFVDTSLSVTTSTLHNAIVRACPQSNASQCSPDSDAGWGPWSNTVTGTVNFTITP